MVWRWLPLPPGSGSGGGGSGGTCGGGGWGSDGGGGDGSSCGGRVMVVVAAAIRRRGRRKHCSTQFLTFQYIPVPHPSQSQYKLYNHKATHSFPIPACQWLVGGCPVNKNVFSHFGKVKIYELAKTPYFYYLLNSKAELFNPL
jgi:hypothetical protein